MILYLRTTVSVGPEDEEEDDEEEDAGGEEGGVEE